MSRAQNQAGGGTPPPAGAAATTRALQSALAAEQAAVYGYGVVGAYLTGSAQATAATDWQAHQEASNTIAAMLQARGTQPAAASVAYQLPIQVQTPGEAVMLAVLIEDKVATTYLSLVGLSSAAVRKFGAVQLQASALRGAAWRGSTVAFPGLPAAAAPHGRNGKQLR